ncbi:MAG: DUF4139 domain-containing protein [Bacteroidota bacterium]
MINKASKFITASMIGAAMFSSSMADTPHHIKQSQIASVRVYQQGAQVERIFTANLESGTNLLYLEGLSSSIDQGSINVNGTGDATLASIGYQLDYLTGSNRPAEVLRLEDSLKTTSRAIEKVNGLEQVYNDEIGMMNLNRSVGGANIGVDIDNLREIADFYRERVIELKVKLIDIHDEQKNLKETYDRLNRQLADWNTKMNRPLGTIVLKLVASKRGPVTFKTSYYTGGASWTPSYDLRARQINQPIQLVYKADVVQNTGEVWNNAHLLLSTGNPSVGGNKPDLQPWYLDFLSPQPLRGQKSYQVDGMAPAVLSMQDGAINSVSEMVTVNSKTTNVDFDIAMPYTINSDNQPATIEIQSTELVASYTYFAVPKLDKDAFLLAKVGNWDGLNLMPGKAFVYFEGNYVGESFVDPGITTDSMNISLGRDKRIVISREKKQEFSQTRIMGGNVVKEHLYEITVKNLKKEPVRLLLEDQVPVSQQGDIKVTQGELSGGSLEQLTGKVTWTLDMLPGGTEKRTIGFTIKSPKDRPVSDQ